MKKLIYLHIAFILFISACDYSGSSDSRRDTIFIHDTISVAKTFECNKNDPTDSHYHDHGYYDEDCNWHWETLKSDAKK